MADLTIKPDRLCFKLVSTYHNARYSNGAASLQVDPSHVQFNQSRLSTDMGAGRPLPIRIPGLSQTASEGLITSPLPPLHGPEDRTITPTSIKPRREI